MMKLSWSRKKPKAPNCAIRGEDGLSARQRCFDLYDRGMLPAEAADRLGIRKDTARRYRSQWVSMNPRIKMRYELVRRLIFDPQGHEILFVLMTGSLGLSEAEAGDLLNRPSELVALIASHWLAGGEDDFYVSLERARVATDIARFLDDTGWDLGRARKDIVMMLQNYARMMAVGRAKRTEPRAARHGDQETPPTNIVPPSVRDAQQKSES